MSCARAGVMRRRKWVPPYSSAARTCGGGGGCCAVEASPAPLPPGRDARDDLRRAREPRRGSLGPEVGAGAASVSMASEAPPRPARAAAVAAAAAASSLDAPARMMLTNSSRRRAYSSSRPGSASSPWCSTHSRARVHVPSRSSARMACSSRSWARRSSVSSGGVGVPDSVRKVERASNAPRRARWTAMVWLRATATSGVEKGVGSSRSSAADEDEAAAAAAGSGARAASCGWSDAGGGGRGGGGNRGGGGGPKRCERGEGGSAVSAWLERREGAHLVCGFGEARDCGRPVLVELSALGVCGLEEGAEREEVVAEARALCRLEGCGPVWRWAGGRGGWWGRRRRDEVGSRLLEAGEDGVDVAEVALVGSVCPVAHLVELVGERVHGGRGVTGQQAMRTTTTSTTSLLVSSCQPCELYCTSAYPGVPLTCPSPPQQGPDSSVQRRTLALDSACQSSSLSSLGHARPSRAARA